MTHRLLSLASLLVFALLVTACGKKSATTPDEPPGPSLVNPPAPKAERNWKERLIGTWEREPVSDGYPVFMEFRADGTATLKHRQPDGKLQVANGTLVLPNVTGSGPYQLQVKVPNGVYGVLVDFQDDELLHLRGAGQEPLRFRKAR
jgi:hypothetical protein